MAFGVVRFTRSLLLRLERRLPLAEETAAARERQASTRARMWLNLCRFFDALLRPFGLEGRSRYPHRARECSASTLARARLAELPEEVIGQSSLP